MSLITQIKREEGFSAVPYKCTAGYWTIGYGRNLDTNPLSADERHLIYHDHPGRDLWVQGLTKDEALVILKNDIDRVREELQMRVPVYDALDQVRADALVNMGFQLGTRGVKRFKKMIAALERQDWAEAAREGLDSKWARRDTPNRAKRVTEQIRTGVYV